MVGPRDLIVPVAVAAVVAGSCGGERRRSDPPPAATTTTLATDLVPVTKGNFRLRGSLHTGLPAGAPGSVDVVRWGEAAPMTQNRLAVVVRNNTASAVTAVEVTATVEDRSGVVVSTGKSDVLAPGFVEPGQPAIGFVVLTGPVPDSPTFAFATTSAPASDPFAQKVQDLFVVSAVARVGQITGRVQNLFSGGVTDVMATYVCFDKNGLPTDAGRVATFPTGLAQGYTGDFAAPVVAACDGVLAAGAGRPNPDIVKPTRGVAG